MELEGRSSMKSDINGAAYLMSWGSEMASLSNIPSVMYLSLVAALEQSSNRTQYPTYRREEFQTGHRCEGDLHH